MIRKHVFAGASLSALLLGLSGTAIAQENLSNTNSTKAASETIVVTGIRASLRSNADFKRRSDQISDSITATDIGKLPDSNVAETLTRIPGVQAYRFGGEAASPVGNGSGITVRGLTNQTASRINGRAYFTAGQRDFNIEGTVPAIVSGVDVFKNPTAEQIEGGIGGVINTRTLGPFDFKGKAGTVSIGTKYNDLGKQDRPDAFGMFSNRFSLNNGGQFGYLIAGSYSQTYNRGDNNPAGGGVSFVRAINAASSEYATGSGTLYDAAYTGRSDINFLSPVTPASLTDKSGVIALYGTNPETRYEMYVRTRKGINAKAEYRPNDKLTFYGEALHNYYQYHQEFGFLPNTQSSYVQNLSTTPFTTSEGLVNRNINGGTDDVWSSQRLIGGTFLKSTLGVLTGGVERDYTTSVLAGGFKWYPNADIDILFDVSYVKATQDQIGRDLSFAPSNTSLTWDLTRDLASEPHTLSIGGPDVSNKANWVYRDYGATRQLNEDDGIAIKGDIIKRFNNPYIIDVKAGFRYATQNDDFTSFDSGRKNLTTDGLALASNRSNAISVASRGDIVYSPNNFMDGKAGYTGGFAIYNPEALLNNSLVSLFPAANIPAGNSQPILPLNTRKFEEETFALYAQANFKFLDDKLKGNIGLRHISTDSIATANVLNSSSVIVPNSGKSSYTDFLPSLNLIGYISPKTMVRFGYGKSMTRPDPASLNPTVSVNNGQGTASLGNSALKPQRGTSYDLSFEHYMRAGSYVAANIFQKDVEGFFTNSSNCENVTGFTYTGSISQGCNSGQYLVTRTVNALDGYAKGFELSGQTFFDYEMVPNYLRNFGVSASYTYVDTNAPVKTAAGLVVNAPLPFSSKDNYSLTAMYEDKKLSARLVYTYRSEAILFGISTNPVDSRYFDSYGMLDASVNIDLPRNLQLVLTASNITNVAPNRFVGEANAILTGIERQHYNNGRTFGASLRWKFGG